MLKERKTMKKFVIVCLTICVMFTMVGCSAHSSMSLTFNVETGDCIKVKLDTTGGWKLTSEDGIFFINDASKETILMGMFIDKEYYDMYTANLAVASGVTMVEEDESNGFDYTLWEITGSDVVELDYVGWLANSNSGVIFASMESREVAKEAFERVRLTIQ